MRVLLIACGNELRRSDGVAHAALALLSTQDFPEIETHVCDVQQITPELSADFSGFDAVIFVDADADARGVTIEPVGRKQSSAVLSHSRDLSFIVETARALFGFRGQAFVCRIPARDFGFGPMSSSDLEQAAGAAEELQSFLQRLGPPQSSRATDDTSFVVNSFR